jgi:histidinol-phosphate aminotransferase
VNRLAQVAALAALAEADHVAGCVARTVQERERVTTALESLGYVCSPSVANFVFFDAREDASELALRLLRYGVIVKPWREPGFHGHVRVSTGTPATNDQFLAALRNTAQPA